MNKSEKTFFAYPNFSNIKEMMLYTVNKFKDHTAFVVKEKKDKDIKYIDISFEEMLEDIYNLGTSLFKRGYQGKKIAVIGKNSYPWVNVLLSTLFGNMIIVPLDKGLTEIEIENSILEVKPDILFFDSSAIEKIEEIDRKNILSSMKLVYTEEDNNKYEKYSDMKEEGKALRGDGYRDFEDAEIDSDKVCELCFTSGTSSKSKVVMLSQRNIASDISMMHLVEDFRDTDVNLQFIPLHHTFGSTGVLFILSYGAKTAFPDGLRYIQANLKEYGVTVFIGVPLLLESMYKKIMKEVEKQNKLKLVNTMRLVTKVLPFLKRKIFKSITDQLGGKLRTIITGAAAIDKDVWQGFNDFGINLVQGYGLTEASPVVIAENCKYQKKGSIGFPLPGVDVKIINKNEMGIGELTVKGPNVMLGYYNNDEANMETFTEDGYMKTGDLAYKDKDGFIFIAGRKKNVIVLKNGKNVYPEEIETLVNKIPEIKDSMVFELPKGETEDDNILSIKVQYDIEYVTSKYPNIDFSKLDAIIWDKIKEVNRTLPTYKYIKHLVTTKEEFIRTTTAKIKRYEELAKMKLNSK